MATPQDELQELRGQVAALTARIYRLEQQAGVNAQSQPEPRVARPPTERVTAPTPAPPPTDAAREPWPALGTPLTEPASEAEQLESKIGKLWLNRIGIFAILVGVSYFIKYAFDNGWIGPTGRIALGLSAGIGLVLWSERFRSKGYAAFAYSLKAVGIGTLYLSLWGSFQVYHLVPSWAAFAAMIVVTACTITLALAQDAEILAAFALVGGFSTPVLLSTGQNHEIVLFSYVCLLDLAILAMVAFKPWRRLLVGSFIGTATLYMGWFGDYYTKDQRALTVFFALVFGAIFATSPLLTPLTKSRWYDGFSITLTLLPLVNAAALFLALFAMYENETGTLTWYALGLAAGYLGLGSQLKRRAGGDLLQCGAIATVQAGAGWYELAEPRGLYLGRKTLQFGVLLLVAGVLWPVLMFLLVSPQHHGFLSFLLAPILIAVAQSSRGTRSSLSTTRIPIPSGS